MFLTLCKLLLAALVLFLAGGEVTGLPNNVAPNYSNATLRLAKSAHVRAFMNLKANPCEDFYDFACGKWKITYPASEKKMRTTFFDQLQDIYVSKSVEMLKSDNKTNNAVDLKLKDFYESCRNADALKNVGFEPILKLVNFKGGWPQVTSSSWYESEYDWLKIVAELRRKLGVNILVGLDIIPDFEIKETHRIKVGAPELDLNTKAAYLGIENEHLLKTYKKSIANKLHKHFKNMSNVWADEVADQVLHVEQELAKGLPENPQQTVNQTSRLRYIAELRAAYGNFIDLNRYFNLIFNETIYVQVYEIPDDYLSNLVEVVKNTPKLTIANYTMWRVLDALDFDGEINNEHNDYWCVHKIIDYFPHQLESMFHRNYNNMEVINEVRSVWADIKGIFREELQTSPQINWITQETRQKAILKLEAMDLEFIAYDDAILEEQIHSVILRKGQYYQNLINILEWRTQFDLARLVERPKTVEPELKVPKYEVTTNKIRIPSIFVQPRFFWDTTYPHAVKYSTIGFLLAQQIMHGFDAIGQKYDTHGHPRNWWDSVSEAAFNKSANCFAEQYTEYRSDDKQVIDSKVLSTLMADHAGLEIAFSAYLKWRKNVDVKDIHFDETLPILFYTKYQTFFITFAQLMCADYYASVKTDPELPPERYRLFGALSNSNQFAKEFKCAAGSKLNPARTKCVIFGHL